MAGIPPVGRRPWGFLGMLALVAGFEAYVACHNFDYMTTDHWNWKLCGEKARQAKGYDLLCFGDSLMKMGVAPRLVEARSGLKGYNLAIAGSQAPASYFLLRRALDSGAKPRALVVHFFPKLQEYEIDWNYAKWAQLLRTREQAELCRDSGDFSLFAKLSLARLLPSFRQRETLRSNLEMSLGGIHLFWPVQDARFCKNWNQNAGAQVLPSGTGESTGDFAAWRQRFFSPITPTPLNDLYQRKFLDLAQAHGIPVFWLIPPATPGLVSELDQSGVSRAYHASLADLQNRYPNLVVIDGRTSTYAPSVFFDPHHLGRAGIYAHSLALGNLIRTYPFGSPTAPRWLALPPFHAPPDEILAQDAAKAEVALEVPSSLRR